MKRSMTFLITVILIVLFSANSFAGWLIFHKPAFRGKVIDAETKEPIEGAVVVAVYNTHSIVGGPAGGWSTIIKVKETLTDKSGEFIFPAYTALTNPNARDDQTNFIFYKPGYVWDGLYPKYKPSPPSFVDLEKFFSEEYGIKKEVHDIYKKSRSAIVTYGVVELPKVETKEERLRAVPGGPTDNGKIDLPLLFKLINEERKRFGLGEVN